MKGIISNKINKLFTLFTILAVFQFVVNNALFIHTHTMANGQIIAHSHPYNKQNKDSSQKHHHTKSAFTALDNLSKVATALATNVILCEIGFQKSFFRTTHYFYFPTTKPEKDGRAPPIQI